jgi:hypothetical protein
MELGFALANIHNPNLPRILIEHRGPHVPQASADQWLDNPSPKPRHPSGTTRLDALFRGEHMNPIAKAILRVVATMIGTAYFISTFYAGERT